MGILIIAGLAWLIFGRQRYDRPMTAEAWIILAIVAMAMWLFGCSSAHADAFDEYQKASGSGLFDSALTVLAVLFVLGVVAADYLGSGKLGIQLMAPLLMVVSFMFMALVVAAIMGKGLALGAIVVAVVLVLQRRHERKTGG